MSNLLETRDLSKVYRKQKANGNINFKVKENTIYGLLGPNGAGKSTLLKMITGMVRPTKGAIYFDGKVLERKDLVQYQEKLNTSQDLEALFMDIVNREGGKDE